MKLSSIFYTAATLAATVTGRRFEVDGNSIVYFEASPTQIFYYVESRDVWIQQLSNTYLTFHQVSRNVSTVVAHDNGRNLDLVINVPQSNFKIGLDKKAADLFTAPSDLVPINGFTLRKFATSSSTFKFQTNDPARGWTEADLKGQFSAKVLTRKRNQTAVEMEDEHRHWKIVVDTTTGTVSGSAGACGFQAYDNAIRSSMDYDADRK